MSEKFNGKPMTPENQRDEDLKKVKENLYRKLTELRLDNPKFGEPLEELVDAALTAQRQSWEREKEELIAESKRAEKEWGYKSEDHYIDKCRRQEAESRIRILEAEKQALEAEKKGLETQLSAWFSTFGTNQLSHAIDRLESAEKEKARLEERVRDMDECLDEQHDELTRLKAENERLFKNSVENEKIFIRNQSALARAHEALEPFATLTEYDVMSAPVAVGWLTNARKALSDPSGSVAFEKWKALQNTKQEYDKAMNVCLDKFSNQKFGSVADCLNGIFEKWKKMGAVVEAARACYEEDDFITENSPGSFERDKKLGEALEALDEAKGERE